MYHILLNCWVWSGAKVCTSCRAWKCCQTHIFLQISFWYSRERARPKIANFCKIIYYTNFANFARPWRARRWTRRRRRSSVSKPHSSGRHAALSPRLQPVVDFLRAGEKTPEGERKVTKITDHANRRSQEKSNTNQLFLNQRMSRVCKHLVFLVWWR